MKKKSSFAHTNRIKQALKRHAHVNDFRPTESQTKIWFNIINREVFGSQLKRPKITVSQKKLLFGQCVANWDARVLGRKGEWDQKKIPYHKWNRVVKSRTRKTTHFI